MRAARVDANQPDIVKALRRVGCLVAITSGVGQGFPDIVVGYRQRIYLVEIKDGTKPPSATKLTKDEQAFHDKWTGYVHIIYNIDDALTMIGATT